MIDFEENDICDKKTTNEIISQIIYFLISILEKAVVFPMVVLSALTMDLELMKDQPNLRWWGAIILVVCGLKLFRSIFSGKSKIFFKIKNYL